MRSYISTGRLSETLLLLSAIKSYRCNTFDDTDQLTVGLLINKQAAFDFALQCAWIIQNNGFIDFTERGNSILQDFDGHTITPHLWKEILYDYVSICRPAWANMIPYGRREAYLFMTNDERRCFNESGLMAGTEEDIVSWWDRLAKLFRGEHSEELEDVGRLGERLTLKYEEKRTQVLPIWESVDSNKSGYDILSKKDCDSKESILIEVKSSFKPLSQAKMIITRNEWDVASCGYNINRYYFYLWLLGQPNKLAIVPAKNFVGHIPNEIGGGRWKEVEISFDLFKYEFSQSIIECE